MKDLFFIIPSIFLVSCSNDYLQSNLGHYKETTANDPDGEFGLFTKQSPAVVVTPDKP